MCVCVGVRLHPLWYNCFCQSCAVHECAYLAKQPLAENAGHLGQVQTTENVSPANHSLPRSACSRGEGGGKMWNISSFLMRNASVWELRVFKGWKSDLRGKSNPKQAECSPFFLSLRFPRQRVEPPNRDVSVISSVRWTVPGEAITLNRFTADTDPASYRC